VLAPPLPWELELAAPPTPLVLVDAAGTVQS
jgi:hypothetical protein